MRLRNTPSDRGKKSPLFHRVPLSFLENVLSCHPYNFFLLYPLVIKENVALMSFPPGCLLNYYDSSFVLNPNGSQSTAVGLGGVFPPRSILPQLFVLSHLLLTAAAQPVCYVRDVLLLPSPESLLFSQKNSLGERVRVKCHVPGVDAPPLNCISTGANGIQGSLSLKPVALGPLVPCFFSA